MLREAIAKGTGKEAKAFVGSGRLVPDELVTKMVKERLSQSDCDKCGGELYQRSDEKPEVIAERLKVYEEQTKPLIDFYRNEALLQEIDASYNIGEVDRIIRQCDEAI